MRFRPAGLALATTLTVLSTPLGAEAQQVGKVYRIGFLSSLPVPPTALADTLRNAGLVEGRNIVVDRRFTEGPEGLQALAAELVGLRPDVIIAYWNRDVVAARAATRSIPIVMVVGVDPAGAGLVESLGHPGGNVTGSLVTEPAIAGKTLQALKQAVPTVQRVAALWNPGFTLPAYYKAMEEAAQASGMTLLSVESRAATDFDAALARVTAMRPHALFVDGLAVPRQAHRLQLIEFVARQRLPTVYTAKHWVVAGGFMSYNASLEEAWSRTGSYVARILSGAKPPDLPVEGPTKFELVINLKTARALGLTVPQSLLLRADQVVE
jgi:putative ABC transport system substrate-binding protein